MRGSGSIRIAILAALVAVTVSGGVQGNHDDDRIYVNVAPCPGDDDGGSGRDATPEDPVNLSGGAHTGCLDAHDRDDVYVVHAVQGQRLQVVASGLEEACGDTRHWQLQMYMRGPEEGTGDYTTDLCREDHVATVVAATGPHKVHVIGWSDWTVEGKDLSVNPGTMDHPVEYQLTVTADDDVPSLCGSSQDDGGSDRDATLNERVTLSAGDHQGCLDRFDDRDGYTFQVDAGDLVRITVTPHACSSIWMTGTVPGGYDYDGASHGKGPCEPRVIGFAADADGWGNLTVNGFGAESVYDVTIERGPGLARVCAPDDGGSGRDSTPDAPVAVGSSFTGCFDLFDQKDYFSLTTEPGSLLRVTFTPPAGCAYVGIEVYDDHGWVDGDSRNRCEPTVNYYLLRDDGTVQLEIFRFLGEGDYAVTWEACPPGAHEYAKYHDPLAEAWCAVTAPLRLA